MIDWQKSLLSPQTSVREAIRIVDAAGTQGAVVVDADRRLLGLVTDGDIRRAILRGVDLDLPVDGIMNRRPTTGRDGETKATYLSIMRRSLLRQLPIVDADHRLLHVLLFDDFLADQRRDNPVVIMAGGLGTRLGPLTRDCPKPLLKVDGRPILEIILEKLLENDLYKIYLAVNFKADMIMDHFGDGAQFGVDISYLREDDPLGTAGALSLLPEAPEKTIILLNGDVLTTVNMGRLLEFHRENEAMATMCVTEYDFQVPYGVVRIRDCRFERIEEKPVQRFFVNAGIYAIQPEALQYVPPATRFDMTDLFSTLRDRDFELSVFPLREYWIDIGRNEDFASANRNYRQDEQGGS